MKNTCGPKIRLLPKSLPEGLLFDPAPAEQEASAHPRESKEVAMKKSSSVPFATTAVLTLAEIKGVVEAFDRGETNVFDALDAIIVAVEAHQAAMAHATHCKDWRRDAA